MGKSKFDLNITNLIGAKPSVVKKLRKQFIIDNEFKWKWNKSVIISKVMALLAIADRWRSEKLLKRIEIKKPPIFIIGHWRSGTTLLHNLISLDPDAAYPTTYQTVFPNNLFAFQGIIKWFMKVFIPAKRPGDGLPLRVNQPQEEEFGIGNEIELCFYYWMFFPRDAAHFRNTYLVDQGMTKEMELAWKKNYLRFVKRTLLNAGVDRFVSKNPPNTARISWILDLFPDAKFIFIHRDPHEVYCSTQKFFKGVIPSLQFQNFTEGMFDEHILTSYVMLHQSYFANKKLIPQENLIEVPYAHLVQHPDEVLKEISKQFKFPTLESASTSKQKGSEKEKKHTIDQYKIDLATLTKINDSWGEVFTQLGYRKRKE